jgi:PIN domain nuclease of toxin-antitoxin system
MSFLLDTHTFLWFINGDPELSEKTKQIIENPDTVKFISIASFWEIAIKVSIGKLQLDMSFEELESHALQNGFELLPITFRHTSRVVQLPLNHKDPFDRILIAQATCDYLTILGKDPNFEKYGINSIW